MGGALAAGLQCIPGNAGEHTVNEKMTTPMKTNTEAGVDYNSVTVQDSKDSVRVH